MKLCLNQTVFGFFLFAILSNSALCASKKPTTRTGRLKKTTSAQANETKKQSDGFESSKFTAAPPEQSQAKVEPQSETISSPAEIQPETKETSQDQTQSPTEQDFSANAKVWFQWAIEQAIFASKAIWEAVVDTSTMVWAKGIEVKSWISEKMSCSSCSSCSSCKTEHTHTK